MTKEIILASQSKIRADLLRNAGLIFSTKVAGVDEDALRSALISEKATPRDIADALAEMKAKRVAQKHPVDLVIGCDQVLAIDKETMSKPQTPDDARHQLKTLRGRHHQLLSAVVIYDENRPVWRHVGVVRLYMRDVSNDYIDDYVIRNWQSIRHSVGSYKLEEEGVRLFTKIEGDYFNVLGLPLLEVLSYLTQRGILPS